MKELHTQPNRMTQNNQPVNGTTTHKNVLGLSQTGAVLAAVISSACCWLPLLLLAFGISGGTLAAQFESWRMIMLPVTFLFLAAAFYFTYRKSGGIQNAVVGQTNGGKEACCTVSTNDANTGTCCGTDNNKRFILKNFNKAMLWVVTIVVLGVAFFPNYVGGLLGKGDSFALRDDQNVVAVQIDGMFCEACAVTLETALKTVPGVAGAAVSFDKEEALVAIPQNMEAPRELILKAVSNAGFTGQFLDLVMWNVTIAGMSCEGCATLIESKLNEVPGVKSATVNYEKKQALVGADATVTEEALKEAVQNAGYQLSAIQKKQ